MSTESSGLPPEYRSLMVSMTMAAFEGRELRLSTCLPEGVFAFIWHFRDVQHTISYWPVNDHIGVKITKGNHVGQGAYSDVYDCFPELPLPLQAAAKQPNDMKDLFPEIVMKVHRWSPHRFKSEESKIKCVEREAYALRHARHPNVIHLIGAARAHPEDVPVLLFPKIHYNLLSYIEAHRDTSLFSLLIPLAEAIAHIHKRGIIHRDIKPGNVLVSTDGTVYLTDFGSCRMDFKIGNLSKEPPEEPSDGGCTIWYAAPETVLHQSVTEASDVFSFGVLLNQIFSGGEAPYPKWMRPGAVVLAVCSRKERPQHPINAGPALCRIISKCWADNPLDRPTMHEVLQELKTLRDAELASFTMAV